MPFIASILGILIGTAFVLVAAMPRIMHPEAPVLARLFPALCGLLLLLTAGNALRRAMRSRRLMRAVPKERATATVEIDESSDSTSYTMIAQVGPEIWAVPIYYGAGVARLLSRMRPRCRSGAIRRRARPWASASTGIA